MHLFLIIKKYYDIPFHITTYHFKVMKFQTFSQISPITMPLYTNERQKTSLKWILIFLKNNCVKRRLENIWTESWNLVVN